MQHAAIEDLTPFAFTHLFSYDAKGRPVVVLVSQATYAIVEDASPASTTHRLTLLEEQPPVNLAGEVWESTADDKSPDPEPHEPEVVSYRMEPCAAFVKPATDVVLLGHAQARSADTTTMRAGIKIGSLDKVVKVFGDRFWRELQGEWVSSAPLAFERIPLRYERAFGGWDRTQADQEKHHAYAENPVGLGYRGEDAEPEAELRLPNIEDPNQPIETFGQVVPPAGFGFLSPGWAPRSKLAGTYDDKWKAERMPYLPDDFDLRFFNAASPGMIADSYLTGREPVALFGVSKQAHMLFALPGIKPPTCTIERIAADDAVVQTQLDTVIIDADARRVTLLHRGHTLLRDGPRDVKSVRIAN